MYICNDCQKVFLAPDEEHTSFSHAFGIQRETSYLCPRCGSADFDEATCCPSCSGDMRASDVICRDCRNDLLIRLDMFFSRLSPAELDQFDEWMDGNSILDRKNWRSTHEH